MISIIFSILISLFAGWLTVMRLMPHTRREIWWDIFLAAGLGLGLCAQITFYSFLLAGQFNAPLILLLNVGIIVVLFLTARGSIAESCRHLTFHRKDIGLALIFLFFTCVFGVVASLQPYGQWDAWAVWNMKTKFLIGGGPAWSEIFTLHWHTQPDYPLLLPFINTWLFSIIQADLPLISSLTGVVFTISCAGLLYAGLSRFIAAPIALLGAVSLAIFPPYQSLGTSQYADIVLSYYLLAAFVCFATALKEKQAGFAAILGMVLGLMSFAKNEGIVMAVILMILGTVSFRSDKKMLKHFWAGILLTVPPAIAFKILAPANRDIGLGFLSADAKFLNFEGIWIVVQEFGKTIFDRRFSYIWPVLLLMFAFQPRRYFTRETRPLTLFFILYFICVLLVYLTTVHFDLAWRLSRTAARVLFILLPAGLFLNFYVYWRKDS